MFDARRNSEFVESVWGRFWLSPDWRRLIRVEPEGHAWYALQIIRSEYGNIKFDDPVDSKYFLVDKGWTRIAFHKSNRGVGLLIYSRHINNRLIDYIVDLFPDQSYDYIETERKWL